MARFLRKARRLTFRRSGLSASGSVPGTAAAAPAAKPSRSSSFVPGNNWHFFECSTVPLRPLHRLEAQHWIVALLDAAVILFDLAIQPRTELCASLAYPASPELLADRQCVHPWSLLSAFSQRLLHSGRMPEPLPCRNLSLSSASTRCPHHLWPSTDRPISRLLSGTFCRHANVVPLDGAVCTVTARLVTHQSAFPIAEPLHG